MFGATCENRQLPQFFDLKYIVPVVTMSIDLLRNRAIRNGRLGIVANLYYYLKSIQISEG